jgi:hypothetical protein
VVIGQDGAETVATEDNGAVATVAGAIDVPAIDPPTCAIPRNDPAVQVVQPSPEQVEWAVHRAVRGELTAQRPANWRNKGL